MITQEKVIKESKVEKMDDRDDVKHLSVKKYWTFSSYFSFEVYFSPSPPKLAFVIYLRLVGDGKSFRE